MKAEIRILIIFGLLLMMIGVSVQFKVKCDPRECEEKGVRLII